MKTIKINQPTIALAMIVRDCPESLDKLLESVRPIKFDEIIIIDTGSGSPATLEVALKHGAVTYKWEDPDPDFFKAHGHISDFASARQFSFDQTKSDYVIWLDADDIFIGAQNFRPQINDAYAKFGPDLAVALTYNYSKDDRGNWNTIQKRTRVVRKDAFYWMGKCHEDLIAKKNAIFKAILPTVCRIEHDHLANDATGHKRDTRNVAILEHALEKDGDLDPRLWKHLGQGYEGLSRPQEAIQCYMKHIDRSNWPEDLYLSHINVAQCYRALGLPAEALKYDLKASEICPQFPNAWVSLAIDEVILKHYPKVLFYTDIAMSCKDFTDSLGMNPAGMRLALFMSRHEAFRELGKIPESLKELQEIEKEYPDINEYKNHVANIQRILSDQNLNNAFKVVAESIYQEKGEPGLEDFLKNSPKRVMDFPEFQWMKRQKPELTQSSIALVCPGEGWGPSSIEKGIGGSEEAVIYLSKELSKLGLWVDVFTNTNEPGEKDGVRWYPFHAIRPERDFYDTVVIWRMPELLDHNWNCSKLAVWLHDVQFESRWNEKRIDKVDHVIFLSEYHRSTAPFIPDKKVVLSRNGLSPAFFLATERDAKKVIFTSNPTRGLLDALKIWPEVHKETGAILHTYYGFTELTKRAFVDQPLEAKKMYEIQNLMLKTQGIVNHGMVGHKELSLENASAGIWFYPTTYPEISCISAMRAQALGAIPICSTFAALKETVQYGVLIEPPDNGLVTAKAALIDYLNNPEKQEAIRSAMMEWAQKNFLWEDVAKQWFTLFEGKTWEPKVIQEKVELVH